jgi:hypothetical protein
MLASNVRLRHQRAAPFTPFPRAEHFLLHMLDPAVRSTHHAAKLKFADDLRGLVGEAKSRLVRFPGGLGGLNAVGAAAGGVSGSHAPVFRGGGWK